MGDYKVYVTGANGMLGRAVIKALTASQIYTPVRYLMDITHDHQTVKYLTGAKIINCAGIVRGRSDVTATRMGEVNALAPHLLAAVAGRLIHVSTDCVFDGTKGPYAESDEPSPSDNYGMSKLIGEITFKPHLTIRTSFIGLGDRGFLNWVLSHEIGGRVLGFRRWYWNGLYVPTLARYLVQLVDDPITGLLHLHGPTISKYDLIMMIKKALRPDLFVVEANSNPKNLVLKSDRINWIGCQDNPLFWDQMLAELVVDYEVDQANNDLASGGDPEQPPSIGRGKA